MPSFTRSAAQKAAKDIVQNSKLPANDSGGKSKTWADCSNPTATNTNMRRSTRAGSSLKKQDFALGPSPSLRRSERLVINRVLITSDLKKTPEHEKKRSVPCPPTKLEKHNKQHCSIEAGDVTTSLKSNNLQVTPRVTRSAAHKAKDDEKSKLSAKDRDGKTSADSSSTLAGTYLRRSTRGSSLKKQDPLSPSPSLRKPDNSSACAKRSEKRSCFAGSKESGKITTFLKSIEGHEQMRVKKRARSMTENGKKEEEMRSADSVQRARMKRLDSRAFRKYLVAQVMMLRSSGNESSNLEVRKDTMDIDWTIRKEKDLNERDPSRGNEEDIKLANCVSNIEVINFSKELRNCSENVYKSEKELCPPSKIPLSCSSNGLEVQEEEGVEAIEMTKVVDMATTGLPDAGSISNTSSEMTVQCSIPETRDACPVRGKPIGESSTLALSSPISYCRGECDPATLSPCEINPLLEGRFSWWNDSSESLQMTRKRARHYEEIDEQEVGKDEPTKCQKSAYNSSAESGGSRKVPMAGDEECPEGPDLRYMMPSTTEPSEPSNSGSTNDGYILQTNGPSWSQQDDTPVRHTLAGPTAQFSQVPLVTTAAYAMRSNMIATHERPQLFPADPLRLEMEKIVCKKELSTKMTDYEIKRLDSERARDIEEVKKKYDALVQAAEVRLQQTHSLLDTNYRGICLNRTLAEAYKYRCRDLKSPSQAAKAGVVHTAQQGWHTLHPMPSHLQTYLPSGISREAASSSLPTQLPLAQVECRSKSQLQT